MDLRGISVNRALEGVVWEEVVFGMGVGWAEKKEKLRRNNVKHGERI
jgi:hypothetical protein